jgi:hypothetical protein
MIDEYMEASDAAVHIAVVNLDCQHGSFKAQPRVAYKYLCDSARQRGIYKMNIQEVVVYLLASSSFELQLWSLARRQGHGKQFNGFRSTIFSFCRRMQALVPQYVQRLLCVVGRTRPELLSPTRISLTEGAMGRILQYPPWLTGKCFNINIAF